MRVKGVIEGCSPNAPRTRWARIEGTPRKLALTKVTSINGMSTGTMGSEDVRLAAMATGEPSTKVVAIVVGVITGPRHNIESCARGVTGLQSVSCAVRCAVRCMV